ncbi:Conserved_hypothetical protein [Hexamita inflata]|uniref:Uncharacterized protein n=1 Tax=Hexamita inflata TaxID=28002 RepID=A0AA86PTS7_9EUKA|nr:Conserved hypothetical protein [Hexamita inflata]
MTDLWQKLKFSEQEASLNYQIMQRNVSEQTEYVRVLTDAVGLSEEYQAYEKDFISARNHINFALENPTRTTKYTPKSLCTALVRIKSCLNNMVLLTKLARHIAHHPVSLPYFEVTAENPLALIYKDNVLNQLNIAILLELSGFCHTESVKLVNAWFENGTKHIPSPTKLRLMFLLGLDYPPLITPSRQLSQRFDAYCFLTAGFEQLVDQVNRNSIFDVCVHEYNTVTQYQLKMRTQKLTPLKIPHFTDYVPLFKTEPVPNFTMSEYDYQMYVIQKERDLKSQQMLQNAITYQLFKQDEPLHREPKQLKLKPTEEEKKTEHTLQFLKRSQNVGRPQTSFKDQKLNQRPVNQFSSIKLKPTAYMIPDDVEVPQEYKYVDYIYEDQEDEEEMEEPEIYEHINAHAKGMSPEVQLKSPVRKITNNSVEIYEDNEDSIPIQHEQTIRILNNSDVINTQKFNLDYMDSPQLQSKESMKSIKSPEKKQDSPVQIQQEVKTSKTPKKEEAKAAVKPAEVKKEDSFDDEPVQKEVKSAKPPKKEEAKAAVKPAEVKKEDSFDDEPVQKEVKTSKTPKKEEAKAAVKPVEVKKEDSFDDEPVQKEVKSAKPPKKEEAKAAVKPAEVKKEDSFDDEPVQKEVKTSKTPKKEEAKAAAKPVEVKKEDSFDDEPVQKEVKTSKTPKKEEAKAAAKPVEVKKEDSFDDEPVQKEVKSAKPPKKEEAKAAVKPAEVKKEDSFDDEPVQKEVKTSKTPKKEEAKAAVKPAEVKKEDSFDDEPVQKEVKSAKPPKKEEAKAAVKPAEVKKEDSFDDEPVQKEVKSAKPPKKEEAKAAVKPAEVKKEDSFDDEPVQKEVKSAKPPKKEEAKAAVKPVEVKGKDSFDDEPVQKEVKSAKPPKKEEAKAAVKPVEQRKKTRSTTNQSEEVKSGNREEEERQCQTS